MTLHYLLIILAITIPTTAYQAIVPYLWHDIAWGLSGLVEFLLF